MRGIRRRPPRDQTQKGLNDILSAKHFEMIRAAAAEMFRSGRSFSSFSKRALNLCLTRAGAFFPNVCP
jgi:hypothetical protein